MDLAKPSSVWHADVNGDGAFTISDVFLWLGEAFFLPGDWLIWTVGTYVRPVAGFLESGPNDYGGVLSGVVSALVWLGFFLVAIIVYGTVRDLDRALTSMIGRGFAEARRRVRLTFALLAYRLRRQRETGLKRAELDLSQEIELSAAELDVLRLHADLHQGYALSESEISSELELRRNRVEEVLSRLRKLGLLETTLGAGDGESAYRLTSAGRGLVVYRQLSRS
jgi:DNA-binding MarR family transcriptional regulator